MTEDEKKSRILNGIRDDLYKQIASSIPQTCEELLLKVQSIESINSIVTERKKQNNYNAYRNFKFPHENEISAFFANTEKDEETPSTFIEQVKAFAVFYANFMQGNKQTAETTHQNEFSLLPNSKKFRGNSSMHAKSNNSKSKAKNQIQDFCVYCRRIGHRINLCKEYREFTRTPNSKCYFKLEETVTCRGEVNVEKSFPEKALYSSALFLPIKVNSFPTIAVLDTGAGISIISKKFFQLLSIPRKKRFSISVRTVNNDLCESEGEVTFDVKIGNRKIHVNAHIISEFSYHILLDEKIHIRRGKVLGVARKIESTLLCEIEKEQLIDQVIKPSDFNICETLSNDLKEKAVSLLMKFRDCFVKSVRDITQTDIIEVEIETKGAPIKEKIYRLPYTHREPLRKILEELLAANIIRPSNSSYCAPILLVKKKSGEHRLVVDYRSLNSKIVNENCYPIPRIEDIIDQVKGSNTFSLLDCYSGFYILPISDKDKHKTAFICPFGLFEFNRLRQGLKISPNNFQMMMDNALSSVKFDCAKNYIDDCLVHSSSANIKLRPSKCEFFKDKITFLGHVLSSKGIELSEDKVNAIINLPEPKTVTEIKSFLGVLNYFKDHIKNLQIIAEPLTHLTPYLNPDHETQLHTDGCTIVIGASLIQIEPEYDFEITYRKGSQNTLCDFLSRHPNNKNFETISQNQIIEDINLPEFECNEMNSKETMILNFSLNQFNDIRKHQYEDKYFKHVIDVLKGKDKGKNKSIRKAAYNYELKDGKLYRVK
ncbi:KRAB-A domain-containing protein-like protein, partial [Dinothrombium tinctorium]